MANQVITAMSSVAVDDSIVTISDGVAEGEPGNPDLTNLVPVQFRFEVTPDGTLGPITASDGQGKAYTVHLKLTLEDLGDLEGTLCCCDENGTTVCRTVTGGCKCDPVG